MNIEERIKKFNDDNLPFYIVEHKDGTFSLCLPLDLLSDGYYPYCQEAFDAYAAEIGEPAYSKNGLKTHGDGYEWGTAFHQAFADDPNIQRILFDCEMGGFFCDSDDLSLLEDFGSRFKNICENTERFIPIVSEGIKKAAEWEAEQERLMKTVRGQLMKNPSAVFDIMTPDGNIHIAPEEAKTLLNDGMESVKLCGNIYCANELLNQTVLAQQTDLFDSNLIRMKIREPEETIEQNIGM